jgi:glycerophosphoryl diester phosphodiesterase
VFAKHQVIGHRGAAAFAPENTMASFKKAHELGCAFIEFDVMLSADGEPFIFHDNSLRRTTSGRGEFGLATSEYIQSLDAGKWFSRRYHGEKVPTLRETLLWLAESGVQANIEIKPTPGTAAETTVAVLTQISRYWPENKPLPLISSFNLEALQLCRSFSPEMPIGLLLEQWQENWLGLARDLGCYSVHLGHRFATRERIESIKKEGYAVCVYTVNRRRLAAKLFDWGVDAVFSDYSQLSRTGGFLRFLQKRAGFALVRS